jgi:hypothetical protein
MTRGRIFVSLLAMAAAFIGGCTTHWPFDDDGNVLQGRHLYQGLAWGLASDAATILIIDPLNDALNDALNGTTAEWREPVGEPPHRLLQSVEGAVRDEKGQAIPGVTMVVRNAKVYLASPETLPTKTVCTGTNGAFVLLMARTDAVCVDFTTEGKRPMRRWFVVATPGALQSLPTDQTDILLVTPYAHVVQIVPTGLVMVTAP